jgi:hypothetical protein
MLEKSGLSASLFNRVHYDPPAIIFNKTSSAYYDNVQAIICTTIVSYYPHIFITPSSTAIEETKHSWLRHICSIMHFQ